MTLREILTNAGIEENTIKTIETAMKANQVYITSEENADIRLRKNKAKIEKLESDLDDAVTKLDSFKELETERDNFKNQIEIMKKEATDREFNAVLDEALKSAKSKNNKIIKALLDKEKLIYKDGKLEGLDEQLETIKKENDFLFEKQVAGVPDFQTGGKGSAADHKTKSIGEKLAEAKNQTEEIKY